MVKMTPLSIVTVMSEESGVLFLWRLTFDTDWQYTRTGFAGSRHHSTQSMSWVASMAAGESRVRVLILLPRLRLRCRLTSALTGSPMVPSTTHFLIYACLGLKRWEYPMVNFRF